MPRFQGLTRFPPVGDARVPEEEAALVGAFGLDGPLKAETASQRTGLAFLLALETAMRSGEMGPQETPCGVGWSPKNGRMTATAYAKSANGEPVIAQPLEGGWASPGDPLRSTPSPSPDYLNQAEGHLVAGGRLLAALLQRDHVRLQDLGKL